MSCCCTATYDLGCVPNCGTMEMTDILATQTGVHILEIQTQYKTWNQTFNATSGQPFDISLNVFNESEQIVFKIKQPDDTYFEYEDSPNTYDCFTVRTKVSVEYES